MGAIYKRAMHLVTREDNTPNVVSQVQNNRVHAFSAQISKGFAHILGSILAEDYQADVANLLTIV